MYFLGNDFIILSLLLLIIIFSIVYIYRDKLFKRKKYENNIADSFEQTIIKYLKTTYPKFKFDFSIFEKLTSNENPDTIKFEIIDNIINQYVNNRPFSKKFLHQIDKNNLWSEYAFYSKPQNDKLPPDWLKRKKAAYQRDNGSCVRCSKRIMMKDSILYIVTPLKENGQYYLENLATLCSDCNRILNNKTKNLSIEDKLYEIAKG